MTNVRPIDVETGEISSDHYLRSRKQDAHFTAMTAYRNREKGSHWVASYHEAIRDITHDLTLTQAGAIIKLLPYLRFKSAGKLINNGKPLKQTDIEAIFKRSRNKTAELLTELQRKGVITIVKEGRSNVFYIAAEFHTMGSVTDGVKFTKLYQAKLHEVVSGMELNDVGILYKILPYFHYTEYYLVANPDEEDVSKLVHLDREQLAEVIGHDIATITKCVRKLRSKKAIMSTRSGYTTRYLVHPDLMFRQQVETEWTRSVRKMFDQHT